MNIPFKVIAINVLHKHESIPNNKWIVKNEIYTVIEVSIMNMQNKILGYKLAEIDLSDCYPYQYFHSNRFAYLEAESGTATKESNVLEESLAI